MSRIEWSRPENRRYERGLDRGVLYPAGVNGVPWDGLIGLVDNTSESSSSPQYYEGVKVTEERLPGDFSASLTAFTYPDEFAYFEGFDEPSIPGMIVGEQDVTYTFGMCYRTLKGDAIQGDRAGYRLHLLYELTALPENKTYNTIGSGATLTPFAWTVRGVPVHIPNGRPACRVIIDTAKVTPGDLQVLEDILYGTDDNVPYLPYPDEIVGILGRDNLWFYVVDNGDGTWTAYGNDDQVAMGENDTFILDDQSIFMTSATTYSMVASTASHT